MPNLTPDTYYFINESEDFGVYKGEGGKPYFGGKILNGSPAASGPGTWDGSWFRRKKDADEHACDLLKEELNLRKIRLQ